MEEKMFELTTYSENEKLLIKDYEKCILNVKRIIEKNPVFIVTDDNGAKAARDKRIELNSKAKQIERLRIDRVKECTSEFSKQCKMLVTMLENHAKGFEKERINYENSKKIIDNLQSPERKQSITVNYLVKIAEEDVDTNKKFVTWCKRNKVILTIK